MTGSSTDADFDRDFQRLRETYRKKLSLELETLGADLAEARGSERALLALDAARQLAHRLKGTAGSYGLEASYLALAEMEAQLERLLEASTHDPAEIWAELQSALERARSGLV